MEKQEKQKVELKDVIIYSSEHCPYCKNVKEEFEKQEIKFEERDTMEFKTDWDQIIKLTGVPSIPTILYEGEYFVPGRDFGNPQGLIQILSTYRASDFEANRHILEKLTTINYNFSQAINHLSNHMRAIDNKITEMHTQLIKKPEIKNEENVNKSTS